MTIAPGTASGADSSLAQYQDDRDTGSSSGSSSAIGFDLKAALLRMVREGASDLHLKVG